MGVAPYFSLDVFNSYNNISAGFSMPRCIAGKMDFATKLDDFTYPGFECQAMDDGSGNIMTLYGQGQS